MEQSPFIQGKVYKRSTIHDLYGGIRQRGIAPSAKYPYIFIFSGKAGHQFGYKDEWVNPNEFSYTGEGQIGDMKFVQGNLALRDHLKNGKRVFLFIDDIRTYVKYKCELALWDIDFLNGPDKNGNERLVIKFIFKTVGVNLNIPEIPALLADDGVNPNRPNVTERQGLVTSRVGQGAYRKSILFRWDFKCAVTNYNENRILIASHILSWKDSNNYERLDVNNGILLSPTYDALFDQHLISFENSGKIILSDSLLMTNYDELGITGKEKINRFNRDNYYYLDKHRGKIV